MTGVMRLYRKELREHRTLLGATVAAIACLYGYVLVGVEGEASTFLLASFPISITTAALTFGLISAFWSEWKGSTHYLLFSLPVSRLAIPVSKYLAVMTAGLAVYLMAVGSILILDVPLETSTQILSQFQLDPKTLMIFFCTQSFAGLILLLGMVVACVSLRYSLARFQTVAISAFLILMFFLYWYLLPGFSRLLGEEMGLIRSQLIYTLMFGFILTAGGFVLFNKKAEI
ncbi:MAG: hypothetical protein CME19_11630 [Gemmatimonadetes bacterium]|nr:hypothetical protein [Gemmatimonadota bacterium]